jgi:2-polyprenyl-3-methyl-5-hydroxy-6-metoxy-1,4-benzoquinol methylase
MEAFNTKEHWENIYKTKQLNEVSWYQPKPETSIEIFNSFNLPKTANIIDVGAGDSFFVDFLLDNNFVNITVLDISENAINRAKKRLGTRSKKVKWIIANSATFESLQSYDFWHDRAAFHFLTKAEEISSYIKNLHKNLNSSGKLVIGTFSENGPQKCSGIKVTRYSEKKMTETFQNYFKKIECLIIDHKTPFNTTQNFIFCSFKKM